MAGEGREFEEIGAKGEQNIEIGPEWAQISVRDFCDNYEKSDKLIRYFLMDDSCDKHVILYGNMQKLYGSSEHDEEISRIDSNSTNSIDQDESRMKPTDTKMSGSAYTCRYCEFKTDIKDTYDRHIVTRHPRRAGYG